MTDTESTDISRYEQIRALHRVSKFKPLYALSIIGAGIFAAVLEGIGVSFIIPIVEIVQTPGKPTQETEGVLSLFVAIYDLLGIPFSLGFVIAGVSGLLSLRWTVTFFVRWLQGALSVKYTRYLQVQSFNNTIEACTAYFDREGSDDILNSIVTETDYAGTVIKQVVSFIEQGFLSVVYLAVALYLAPLLTLFAIVFLGSLAVLFRFIIEPGYEVGQRVAEGNERTQRAAQAATQGIRDTKVFGLETELRGDFLEAVNQYAEASIRQLRNQKAIQNFYNLLTAVSVFILIYLAIQFAQMSLASLSVFLFAMFRLGPKASTLNSTLYQIENNLPHLVRLQAFIDDLERNSEQNIDSEPTPEKVRTIEFDDVYFTYETQTEPALRNLSFEFEKGEFVGFVGQSGAGKSTIVSLLARLYEPDDGCIRANGSPIHRMDIEEWRSKIAVVRQDPFIFNDTLRYNLTVGNREASTADIDWACDIAKITEFFDDLPNGYETKLGDNGVRLSGGQRQRIALARALLKEAEVLVLDEATSDLDSDLERQLQDSIESIERSYAIIGIAHRLSTVKNADRIYTIEDGEIIETGRHEELLAAEGKYAELYSIQSRS